MRKTENMENALDYFKKQMVSHFQKQGASILVDKPNESYLTIRENDGTHFYLPVQPQSDFWHCREAYLRISNNARTRWCNESSKIIETGIKILTIDGLPVVWFDAIDGMVYALAEIKKDKMRGYEFDGRTWKEVATSGYGQICAKLLTDIDNLEYKIATS